MKNNKSIFILSLITSIGTFLYWMLVFTGVFPVKEVVPGFTVWFYSFPLADFWIMLTSAMLAVSLVRKDRKALVMWGFLTSSALIFLALNGFMFGIYTGALFMMTMDEIIEIAIKIYCIGVAIHFSRFAWHILKRESDILI